MTLRITIDDRESWMEMYERLREIGFLKDISPEDMDLSEDLFPMEFFIDVDPLLSMIGNPMVKPFRKKIDSTLTIALNEAIM